MFNLLPDSLKEVIRTDYKTRLIVVFLVMVIFIQLSALIFIVPSWVLSSYKEKEIILDAEAINQSVASKNTEVIVSLIRSTNEKLRILDTALTYQKLYPIINTIILSKDSSIGITDLFYTRIDEKSADITLRGVSSTREALVAFVKDLEKSTIFKSVDLPVSNLAKDKNIDFYMNLSVEK